MKSPKPARLRSDEHLKPMNVSKEIWLYAEKKNLCVVRHKNSTGEPDSFFIPWKWITRALRIRPARTKAKRGK